MTTTIHQLAGQAYDAFETAARATVDSDGQQAGESYVRTKITAPDWVSDAVKAAHESSGTLILPDDWTYDVARDAFGAIHDAGEDADLDEVAAEFADSCDIYTSALLNWLRDYPAARDAVQEAAAGGLMGEEAIGDIDKQAQVGQYVARGWIFQAIAEALRDQAEEES